MNTYTIFDDILDLSNVMQSFLKDPFFWGGEQEYPLVKLYEQNDNIVIEALIPGVRHEDLNLQLVDSTLVIEGEKKADEKEGPSFRRERSFGRFQKSIKLPHRVNADDIKAELKNGVLTIRLVRSEDSKPRKIEVR